MIKKIIFLLFACTLSIATEKREGVAINLKNGTFLYKEIHLIEKNKDGLNQKITTIYKDEMNSIFAKMTSDFSKHTLVPDTLFEDFRFKSKYEQTLNLKEQTLEMSNTINQVKKNTKNVKIYENTVAGQGFDNFLKENFYNLKNKKIRFIVLDQLDFFNFKASTLNHKVVNESQFELAIDSFWAGLLVNPITVTYSNDSKKLIRYKGISNIFDKNEKSQEVLISYRDTNEDELGSN